MQSVQPYIHYFDEAHVVLRLDDIVKSSSVFNSKNYSCIDACFERLGRGVHTHLTIEWMLSVDKYPILVDANDRFNVLTVELAAAIIETVPYDLGRTKAFQYGLCKPSALFRLIVTAPSRVVPHIIANLEKDVTGNWMDLIHRDRLRVVSGDD